ncbi:hypothetical protein BGZ54_005172, partial [Gamsiella multidivaricata]
MTLNIPPSTASTKADFYQDLELQVQGIVQGQRNWSVASSTNKEALILGPFQGRIACTNIEFGRGVCGTAAAEKRTLLVKDVHEFPGHIACDSASNSEVVVPLVLDG